MARVFASSEPERALKFAPHYSAALIADNHLKLRSELNSDASDIISNNSIKALKRQPLSGTPIAQIAELNLLQGNRDIAHRLFNLAISRNNHDKETLINLITIDILSGNLSEAVSNLDALINLQEENLTPYYSALMAISKSEQGHKIINKYLEQRPVWGEDFLLQCINSMERDTTASITQSMSIYTYSQAHNEFDKKINEKFLSKLIELEVYEEAYAYWEYKLPQDKRNISGLIHDPNFKGSNALTPFNWKLQKKQSYYTEIQPSGGLYLSYSSNQDRGMANQILRLNMGETYDLSIEGDWDYNSRKGYFTWQVRCLPSWKTLAKIELMNDENNIKPLTSSFTIPKDNCAAQRIELTGRSTHTPARITANISAVSISLARLR